ncbi:hypothetical protein EJB05_37005, partial [Eragrostis curvula]
MAYLAKAVTLLILTILIVYHVQAEGLSVVRHPQEKTGKIVEEQPEYRVTIKNDCSCPQADVKVRCYGVDTVEDLDKSKIHPLDDERCIIAEGKPIPKGAAVIFTYAFQTPQDFPVVSAKPRHDIPNNIQVEASPELMCPGGGSGLEAEVQSAYCSVAGLALAVLVVCPVEQASAAIPAPQGKEGKGPPSEHHVAMPSQLELGGDVVGPAH